MLHRVLVEIETKEESVERVAQGLKSLMNFKLDVLWSKFSISRVPENTAPELNGNPKNGKRQSRAELELPAEDAADFIPGASNINIHAGTTIKGIAGLSESAARLGLAGNDAGIFLGTDYPENFLGFGDTGGEIFSITALLDAIAGRFEKVEKALQKTGAKI